MKKRGWMVNECVILSTEIENVALHGRFSNTKLDCNVILNGKWMNHHIKDLKSLKQVGVFVKMGILLLSF